MQSRAILMIEHRIIERMISLIDKMIVFMQNENKIDPHLIEITVDFIQKYADNNHHGKEEDILFKILKEKKLSDEDRTLMNELIEEHVYGRKMTRKLSQAKELYQKGDASSLKDIVDVLRILKNFYPKHIEKEDEIFFPASMKYLSDKEDQNLLGNYYEFDKKMMHKKYISLIDSCEKQLS
jgi:hemerythrin-like domain-containing protein